jgi:hypothetical protein
MNSRQWTNACVLKAGVMYSTEVALAQDRDLHDHGGRTSCDGQGLSLHGGGGRKRLKRTPTSMDAAGWYLTWLHAVRLCRSSSNDIIL